MTFTLITTEKGYENGCKIHALCFQHQLDQQGTERANLHELFSLSNL